MIADPNALKNVFNLSFKKKNHDMAGKILLYGLQCSLEPMLALMARIFKSTPRPGFSIILLCGMQMAWALQWEAPSHMSDSLTPVSL